MKVKEMSESNCDKKGGKVCDLHEIMFEHLNEAIDLRLVKCQREMLKDFTFKISDLASKTSLTDIEDETSETMKDHEGRLRLLENKTTKMFLIFILMGAIAQTVLGIIIATIIKAALKLQ